MSGLKESRRQCSLKPAEGELSCRRSRKLEGKEHPRARWGVRVAGGILVTFGRRVGGRCTFIRGYHLDRLSSRRRLVLWRYSTRKTTKDQKHDQKYVMENKRYDCKL